MNGIISFFCDTLSGGTYAILVFVCLFLIFACIGYLVSEKLKNESVNLN